MAELASARIIARFRVGERQAGLRLDHFLKAQIPKLSRVRIQDAIRSRIELPGRGRPKPALVMHAGDLVLVRELVLDEPPFPAELTPVILHLDNDLVAVDKPAGLAVHATRRTVKNQLIRWLRDRYGESVALAHRLDRETSGIVLSTRSSDAARALARDFATGAVHKEYLAIVMGTTRLSFEVDAAVGQARRSAVHIKQEAGVEGGLPARTRFRTECTLDGGAMSLVRAFPETGRRHQIRVHLALAGHPVVGDKLYARGERHFLNFMTGGMNARMLEELGAARHLLHAARIEISNPRTGEIANCAPPRGRMYEGMNYKLMRDCVEDFQRQGWERAPE